jgi:hypothetical protein
MFEDSDDGSDVAPPPKKALPKSKAAPKKKSMFDDSD